MHEALLEIYYKNKVTIFFITHDLEEAIFLGHKVAIMTTRPCKPKKILDVDIPHPRDYSVLTSKRFRELMDETNEAVHEEALKAFAGRREGGLRRWRKDRCLDRLAAARLPSLVLLVLWEIGSPRSRGSVGSVRAARALLGAVGFKAIYLSRGSAPCLRPPRCCTSGSASSRDAGYWQSWYMSFFRVLSGLLRRDAHRHPVRTCCWRSAALRTASFFPTFEVLRPIPPLAWVPASIIFWPTQELSITFVTFLGAFFTIVINVLGGAQSIDVRYFQAAQSMGASKWDIFRRIILPGDAARRSWSGSAVGMGITWEVVVAAEMISGGGSQAGGHRRRARLLHLELVRRRLLRADRGRHDQHRHRRLHLAASSCACSAASSRHG